MPVDNSCLDAPRARGADLGAIEDISEITNTEEFQGTFNVLVSAKIAIASKVSCAGRLL